MIKLKKNKFILIIVSVVIITLLVAGAGLYIFSAANDMTLVSKSNYTKMKKISDKYAKLYKIQTTVNSNSLWKTSDTKEMNAMYKALVNTLNDEYSVYMTKSEATKWNSYVNGTFYGIGVSFSKDDKGHFVVLKVFASSPAKTAGLKTGDRILAVNGKTYKDLDSLGKAIRGKEGTTVKLKYSRDGVTRVATMTRAEITEDSVYGTKLKGNIGYIWISSFSKNTASEFKTELKSLENKNVKGLVVDIRENGGGYTDQGIKVADMLLPEGTITYMQDKDGKKQYYNSDESCTKLKYVLLVDGNTASTSEILAAAIKDNNGGKIVGTTTYGKGIVQGEYNFKDGSALKLTVYQYFSPKGNKIHKIGVKPDYQVKLKSGSSKDYQLNKALELLK